MKKILMATTLFLVGCVVSNQRYIDNEGNDAGIDFGYWDFSRIDVNHDDDQGTIPWQDQSVVDGVIADTILVWDVVFDVVSPPDLAPIICSQDSDCDDGISCTEDKCQLGICVHPLRKGFCFVKNNCVQEGDTLQSDPSYQCSECITSISTSTLTSVSGKECNPGGTKIGGMCVNNTCMGWVETFYMPPVPGVTIESSALNAVDYLSSSNDVWAGGEYSVAGPNGSNETKGVLIKVGTPSAYLNPTLVDKAVKDLHYRIALADNATYYYNKNNNWIEATAIKEKTSGINRTAIWGTALSNGNEIIYLTGTQTNTVPGVVACNIQNTVVTCAPHTGFTVGHEIVAIFGTLTATGTQGPLWSIPVGQYDDIFYNDGISTTWNYNAPQGCHDETGSPCSNNIAGGDYIAIHGTGPNDVWVVGGNGLILHYDGSSWQRLTNIFTGQGLTQLDGVYASKADNLVTIVGHRNTIMQRKVILVNYDPTLKIWSDPIEMKTMSGIINSYLLVHDIGGNGYKDLWMVGGYKVPSSSGSVTRKKGWILQLQ